jgi:WD40 repeat protein
MVLIIYSRHPDSDILASCSYDNTIKIWKDSDDDDWYCSQTLSEHTSTVWSLDFNKSGNMFASCSDDSTVRLFQLNSQDQYENFQTIELKQTLYSISWSKINGMIVTCGSSNSITFINEDFKVCGSIDEPHGSNDVNCVVWCNVEGYGHLLASGGDDCNVKIHFLDV